MQTHLQSLIETAYEQRAQLDPRQVDPQLSSALREVVEALDSGQLRVAEKHLGSWRVHTWVKKAVLLYFRVTASDIIDGQFSQFFDKVPLKFAHCDKAELQRSGVRTVPPACVRKGAYVASGTVIMPSFINIGAYVDSGSLIDTWATVGSCAQIGKNVHLSGGAGIGGVLEPVQANPTIIEDNCFIGARSEIAEGVVVEEGAVISMGVFIGQSTRIYDRASGEVSYGRVPAGAVVVPGNLPGADGKHSLYCAVIVKRVDEKTRSKVSINELLRD